VIARDQVTACILAGGRATRFGGRLKCLLEIDGVTILERQRAVLAPLVADLVLSVADPAPFAGLGLPTAVDAFPDAGPLGGIASALRWTPRPWLLVLAGDMPRPSAAVLARMLERGGDGIDAVVPRIDGWPEPLCALYGRSCEPALARRLEAGRYKASGLATDEGLRVIWIDEPELRRLDPHMDFARNVNRPDDLPR
jgi:molybdopterin-guanine dinucleotide biosynthesis protein A